MERLFIYLLCYVTHIWFILSFHRFIDTDAIIYDDVIKWKHFPRYWLFLREIYRSSVTSLHKGQWRGALMFYLICAWINRWVNNCEAGDLIRHRTHCDVIVMLWLLQWQWSKPDLHGYIMLPNHNKPKQNSNHMHNSHTIIYLKQYDLHWFHSPLFHSILNNIFPTKSPVETSSV